MNAAPCRLFCVGVAAILACQPTTTLEAANVIVDDSFADGGRDNGPDPLDTDWFTTTTGSAIEVTTGSLGLVSGTSGRGIRAVFPEQNLAVGDTLTATYTFTTPATIGVTGTAGSSDFRAALFNSVVDPANGTPADLAQDLSASSSNPNPLYEDIGGYEADYDVAFEVAEDANIAIRERITTPEFLQVGRLLATTSAFDTVDTGEDAPDDGYSFNQPNTEYVGVLSITRTGVDTVEIFSSLSEGDTLLGSFSAVDDATDDSQHAGITTSFSQLAFHVGSRAFGVSNDPGMNEAGALIDGLANDNGIEFTNVRIEFTPIPEPSSLIVAAGALFTLLLRSKRR